MRACHRLFWAISFVAVTLTMATPSTHAQCDPARTFSSLGHPSDPWEVKIDVTGSTSGDGPSSPGVIGRFWGATNSAIGNNFEGLCPAVSSTDGWWVVSPGPPGFRALDGSIGSFFTTPECIISTGCPWPDDLVVVVEDTTSAGEAAFVLVMRVGTSPPIASHDWDFRRVTGPPPPVSWILPFERFPVPSVTSALPVGPDLWINLEAEDVARSFWGANGSFPPPVASNTIQSYDLYVFHGPADPGRSVSNWELIHQEAYADGPLELTDLVLACGDTSVDIHLALGLTFHGYSGPDVVSSYVGESVMIECPPAPQPPTGVWTSIGSEPHEDVVVSWNPGNTAGTAHFRILRAGDLEGPYSVRHDTFSDPDPLATSWIDAGAALDSLPYFYKVEAVGHNGTSVTSDDLIAAKLPYQLEDDWNLVSFPLAPHADDRHVTEVFKTIDWDCADIWDAADTVDPWKAYCVFKPPPLNDLPLLANTMGIWVRVDGPDDTWRATGSAPNNTRTDLITGWNLIGFPSLSEEMTAAELKDRIAAARPGTTVLGIEKGGQNYPYGIGPMDDDDLLQHGRGYWVQVDQDVSVELSVAPTDLRLFSSDIFVIDSLGPNQSTVVGATVRNVGTTASLPIVASFYDGENLIGVANVGPIPGGLSATVTVDWTPVPGTALRVVLDYNGDPGDGYVTEVLRTWIPTNEIPMVVCNGPIVGTDPGQCSGSTECDAVAYCSDPNGDPTLQTCESAGPHPVGQSSVIVRCSDGLDITTRICDVTVEDQEPPQISVEMAPSMLWPPNHRLVDVTVVPAVSDACGPSSFVLTSLTSNESDNGEGDGNTVDDIQGAETGTADLQFALRAERAGGGFGRTYTAVYTATDSFGNASSEPGHAVVPHDQGGLTDPIQLELELTEAGSLLRWSTVPDALSYDVVRGNLGSVVETDAVIHLGTLTCIEEDSADATTTGFEDLEIPDPGGVFFYLVEYFDGTSSSYGTESASKPRAPGTGGCD